MLSIQELERFTYKVSAVVAASRCFSPPKPRDALAEASSYANNPQDGGSADTAEFEWVQREVHRQYQRRGGLRRTPLVIDVVIASRHLAAPIILERWSFTFDSAFQREETDPRRAMQRTTRLVASLLPTLPAQRAVDAYREQMLRGRGRKTEFSVIFEISTASDSVQTFDGSKIDQFVFQPVNTRLGKLDLTVAYKKNVDFRFIPSVSSSTAMSAAPSGGPGGGGGAGGSDEDDNFVVLDAPEIEEARRNDAMHSAKRFSTMPRSLSSQRPAHASSSPHGSSGDPSSAPRQQRSYRKGSMPFPHPLAAAGHAQRDLYRSPGGGGRSSSRSPSTTAGFDVRRPSAGNIASSPSSSSRRTTSSHSRSAGLSRAHTYTSVTSPRNRASDHDPAHSTRPPEHIPNVSSSRVSNFPASDSHSHSKSKPMVVGSLRQQLMLEKARKQQLTSSDNTRPSTSPRPRSRASHRPSPSARDDQLHSSYGRDQGAVDIPSSSSRRRHRDLDDDDVDVFSVGSSSGGSGGIDVDSNYFAAQHRHGNRRIPRSVPVHRTVPQRSMTTPRQRAPAPATDRTRHHHQQQQQPSTSRRSRGGNVSNLARDLHTAMNAAPSKHAAGTRDSVLLRGVSTRADYFGGQPDVQVLHQEPHSAPAAYSGKQYLMNAQGDLPYNPKSTHKRKSMLKRYSTLPLPLVATAGGSPAAAAAAGDPNTENLLPLSVSPIPEHREVYSRSPSREQHDPAAAWAPLYAADDDSDSERGMPPRPRKRGPVRSFGDAHDRGQPDSGSHSHPRCNSDSHSRSHGTDEEEIDLLDDKVDVFMSHARSMSIGSNACLTSPLHAPMGVEPSVSSLPNTAAPNPAASTVSVRRVPAHSPVTSPRIDLSDTDNVPPSRMSLPSPRTVSPSFSASSQYHPPVSHHVRRRSGGSGNIVVPPLDVPLALVANRPSSRGAPRSLSERSPVGIAPSHRGVPRVSTYPTTPTQHRAPPTRATSADSRSLIPHPSANPMNSMASMTQPHTAPTSSTYLLQTEPSSPLDGLLFRPFDASAAGVGVSTTPPGIHRPASISGYLTQGGASGGYSHNRKGYESPSTLPPSFEVSPLIEQAGKYESPVLPSNTPQFGSIVVSRAALPALGNVLLPDAESPDSESTAGSKARHASLSSERQIILPPPMLSFVGGGGGTPRTAGAADVTTTTAGSGQLSSGGSSSVATASGSGSGSAGYSGDLSSATPSFSNSTRGKASSTMSDSRSISFATPEPRGGSGKARGVGGSGGAQGAEPSETRNSETPTSAFAALTDTLEQIRYHCATPTAAAAGDSDRRKPPSSGAASSSSRSVTSSSLAFASPFSSTSSRSSTDQEAQIGEFTRRSLEAPDLFIFRKVAEPSRSQQGAQDLVPAADAGAKGDETIRTISNETLLLDFMNTFSRAGERLRRRRV